MSEFVALAAVKEIAELKQQLHRMQQLNYRALFVHFVALESRIRALEAAAGLSSPPPIPTAEDDVAALNELAAQHDDASTPSDQA